MSVPVESVQLEQARQDNLSPDIVVSLSQSPFLSVQDINQPLRLRLAGSNCSG